MNYLAHLHLGGNQRAQLLGSLYGDFVKGWLSGQWPAEIEAAIRLHRRIDAFTDSHPLLDVARARFPRERRRYAGSLLDLFFDHCLARHWRDYADEPLAQFSGRVYQVLLEEPRLPGHLALIAPRMAAQDWLGSYRDFAVLQQVLAGMPSCVDAALLSKMADRGQITGAYVDGPLALDAAIDKESAEIKKLTGPVAGDADCLLFPNIEAGNVFYKTNTKMAGAELGAFVAGARVPCVLSSRGDSAQTKLYSIALAAMIAK
mgnify:CR=1 FL=1